jgi:La domain/RNA binding motif
MSAVTAPGSEALNGDADAAQATYSPGPPGESEKDGVVRKQMEFWFSPSNMRRDWYLRRQMDADGWLDPAIFLRFNRMKQLNASLPEVVEACKGSSLLEVSAPDETVSFGDSVGQSRVRRRVDISSHSEDAVTESEHSLIAENIPEGSSTDSVTKLFLAYGEVTYVWVSKPSAKDTVPYAIVSFRSIEAACAALDAFHANPPPSDNIGAMTVKTKVLWDALLSRRRASAVVVRISGLEGTIMWRDLWNELTSIMLSHSITMIYFLYKNGDDSCYITLPDQDSVDIALNTAFVTSPTLCGCDVKLHVLTDEAEQLAYWEIASRHQLERKMRRKRHMYAQSDRQSAGTNGDESSSRSHSYSYKSPAESKGPPRGVIVRVEGLPSTCGWRRLMSELNELGNVVFLNYKNEEESCFVRFVDAATSQRVVEKLSGDGPVMLLGSGVTASIVSGVEEDAYWERAAANRQRKKAMPLDGSSKESASAQRT